MSKRNVLNDDDLDAMDEAIPHDKRQAREALRRVRLLAPLLTVADTMLIAAESKEIARLEQARDDEFDARCIAEEERDALKERLKEVQPAIPVG